MPREEEVNLQRRLGDTSTLTVLNLGAGHCASEISQQFQTLKCRGLINVEVFPLYVDVLKSLKFMSPVDNHLIDAALFLLSADDRSYDVVVMIDVLEHFTKNVGTRLICEMKRVCAKRIVIFLPVGTCEQGAYDGNTYQQHLSTWEVGDLADLSFETELLPGFHGEGSAAWAIYNVE